MSQTAGGSQIRLGSVSETTCASLGSPIPLMTEAPCPQQLSRMRLINHSVGFCAGNFSITIGHYDHGEQ